ncbi:cytochrome ubiquinol oxidase subunit I [Roseovarius sp. SYSU LYC5161]|uniref:cytochrome ubiquinol oxidase subunit I n=1 Tax=Roseovarius halophilus (ex Wu et al. 2025) TaxID=3376060 RepID=UPI003999A5B0
MLDGFTAETLARMQFAFTVSFHIIFPAFSIGLASYLAVLNAQWLRTRNRTYLQLFDYWKKIFAVAFGMGVVSGIVMSYQFGTNWSVFSDWAGPVIGPLMAYEVLSAFFLEAGFLGIMLFGRDKVGERLHMFATAMVAFGTLLSATWILSVNSWMQTPAGYSINEAGQFVPENWWKIVFNPSFPYRLLHMVLAAYLTTALVVAGAAGWQMLRGRATAASRTMFSMALWMVVVVAPLQIVAGDVHGLNTLEHQPAKVMAMEGHYESHPEGAPLILFGIPDPDNKEIDYALEIPKLSSLILKHDLNAPMAGLDTIPDDEEPPVGIVFWSFRVMVALGFAMLGLGAWSLWRRWRGGLYDSPWLQRAAVAMGPAGFVAVLAGWVTTEVGRQPFTVYGLMRTSDSLAPVEAPAVATSLLVFIVVYFFIFGAGTFYILRLMTSAPGGKGPDATREGPLRSSGITPAA